MRRIRGDASDQEFDAAQVIFHPDVDPNVNLNIDPSPITDIALVRLTEQLPLNWALGEEGHRIYRGDTEDLVGQTCLSVASGPAHHKFQELPDDPNNPTDPETREVMRYGFHTITGVPSELQFHRPGGAFLIAQRDPEHQHLWVGDSGSPCFIDGEAAGVLTWGRITPEPHIGAYAKTERYRDWVDVVLFESGSRDLSGDEQADVVVNIANGDVFGLTATRARNNSLDFEFGSPALKVFANGWTPVGTGDFDEDGALDYVFQFRQSGGATQQGMVGVLLSSGGFVETRPPSSLNWEIQAIADVNRDNVSDLIWRNQATGATVWWAMNNLVLAESPARHILASKSFPAWTSVLGPDWEIVAAADFDRYEILDNDEFAIRAAPDLLWRNRVTGENRLALMDYWAGSYAVRRTVALPSLPPDFIVGGVGDYNVDGWADVLWECRGTTACTEGQVEVWIRLNPHSPTAPDPDRPWRNFEFTQIAAQCRQSNGTLGNCILDSETRLLGPG